jgi:hypothetical protein
MIQIKRVGMSRIFYFTKFNFPKCNISRVIKSSRAVSLVNVRLKPNVSETSSASVIRVDVKSDQIHRPTLHITVYFYTSPTCIELSVTVRICYSWCQKWVLTKSVLIKVFHPLKMYQNTKFHCPTVTVSSFHPPQNSERSPYWNGWS